MHRVLATVSAIVASAWLVAGGSHPHHANHHHNAARTTSHHHQTVASPVVQTHTVLTSPHWTHAHRAESDMTATFKIALHHGDAMRLLDTFERVFDPKHSEYLHYPSQEDLTTMLQPPKRVLTAVREWIDSEVCTVNRASCSVAWSPYSDVATVTMAAREMESFIGSEVHVYKRVVVVGGATERKCLRSSLSSLDHLIPTHLRPYVSHTAGLTQFPPDVRAHSISHAKTDQQEVVFGTQSINMANYESDREIMHARLAADTAEMAGMVTDVPDGDAAVLPLVKVATGERAINVNRLLLFCSVQPRIVLAHHNGKDKAWCMDAKNVTHTFQNVHFELNGDESIPSRQTDVSALKFMPNPWIDKGSPVAFVDASLSTSNNYIPYKMTVTLNYDGFQQSQIYPFYLSPTQPKTPALLKSVVGLPDALVGTQPDVQLSIGALYLGDAPGLGGFYNTTDLDLFSKHFGLSTPRMQYTDVSKPAIPLDQSRPDGETQLDVQYGSGLINHQKTLTPGSTYQTTVFHSSDVTSATPFADIIDAVLDTNKNKGSKVTTLSFSYGGDETDAVQPMIYENTRFAALALTGVSVFVSSGDTGAYNVQSPSQALPDICKAFAPQWPTSSPYVTSVGATGFKADALGQCPRVVQCSMEMGALITGGGGFSNYFPMPAYQADLATDWRMNEKCVKPAKNFYNQTNRAYPDIALSGHYFPVVNGGVFGYVDGTSASAPSAAGMFTLINDLRARRGLPPLGFLNKVLYHAAAISKDAFVDITEGNNRCLAYGEQGCCSDGYHACDGWDPVTGLGQPNFAVLAPQYFNVTLDGAVTSQLDCNSSPASSDDKKKLAIIIGCSVGGGLLLILLLACCWRRSAQKRKALTDSSAQYAVLPGGAGASSGQTSQAYVAPVYNVEKHTTVTEHHTAYAH